jgi:hypothetical protein
MPTAAPTRTTGDRVILPDLGVGEGFGVGQGRVVPAGGSFAMEVDCSVTLTQPAYSVVVLLVGGTGIFTAGIFTAGIFTAGTFTAGTFTASTFTTGTFTQDSLSALSYLFVRDFHLDVLNGVRGHRSAKHLPRSQYPPLLLPVRWYDAI